MVLLDTGSERYYSLTGVGARFWGLLRSDPSVDHAVARLLEEFDVEEGQLRADLEKLWHSLSARKLAVAHADGPGPA